MEMLLWGYGLVEAPRVNATGQRALAIHEQALGPNHPDTATSLNNVFSL